MMMRRLLFIISLTALAGCTTIGLPDPERVKQIDFGEKETLKLCVLKDRDVNQERINDLVDALRLEFNQYGIGIDVPWIKEWDRPGFWSLTIIEDVSIRPLQTPCDRLFAFVGRDARDFAWGILPEILGMVEATTFTKGFAVAEWGSPNQLVPPFMGPKDVTIHEAYHLLGCEHALTMTKCYDKIQRLKEVATKERMDGSDFFPTLTRDGKILKTRNEVDNEFFQLVVKKYTSFLAK